MVRPCLLLAGSLVLGVAHAHAADDPPQRQRIRLVSRELGPQLRYGSILTTDETTVFAALSDRAGPVRLRWSSIERLDVTEGMRGHALEGVWVGAGVGLCLGFLSRGGREAPGIVLLGGVPFWAAVGALVGGTVKTQRWDSVSLSVAVAPHPRGGGAGLTLRF